MEVIMVEICNSCGSSAYTPKIFRYAYGFGESKQFDGYKNVRASKSYSIQMLGREREAYCSNCISKIRKEAWKKVKYNGLFEFIISIIAIIGSILLLIFTSVKTIPFFIFFGGVYGICSKANYYINVLPRNYLLQKQLFQLRNKSNIHSRFVYRIFDNDHEYEVYTLTENDLPKWHYT
jgi:hypothetical protein